MTALDPRLHAFRPDLADAALKGRVQSARFVPGQILRVRDPVTAVRKEPREDSRLATEALYGELVRVFEMTSDGWAWAQLEEDGYVGWIPRSALAELGAEPTHCVAALRTLVFAAPDIKSCVLAGLPMGARVTVTGSANDRNAEYALIAPAGAVVVQHLAPLGVDACAPDWTAVAEKFLGAPYLWGGKTSLGLDCSGLVQVALRAYGIAAPRDSDMQEQALGKSLSLVDGLPRLQRGDLVFWAGHVGLMQDGETLLHANAHHMAVASEPLAEATQRMQAGGKRVTSIRRIW